jgi:hypothetical protein
LKILKVCVAVAVMAALAGAAQSGPAGLVIGGQALAVGDVNAVSDVGANPGLTRWRDGNDAGQTMPWAATRNGAPHLTGQAFGSVSLPTTEAGDSPGAPSCGRNVLATPYPGASAVAGPMGDACDPRGMWPASAGPFQGLRSCCDGSGAEFALMPGLARYFSTQDGAQLFTGQVEAAQALVAQPGAVAAAEPEPQSLALMLLTLGAALMASKVRPRSRYSRF